MKRIRIKLLFLISACMLALAFGVLPASAATENATGNTIDIYLKLDKINGDATTSGYEKWIKVNDVSFDVKQSLNILGGKSPGLGAGKAIPDGLTISKQFDSSSIPLFLDMVSGKPIANGEIVFVKKTVMQPILTIDLQNIGVQDYNFSDLNEDINLKFGVISFKYANLGGDGKTMNTTGSWNLTTNKVSN